MNPWWETFIDLEGKAHDRQCYHGEECDDRNEHISEGYVLRSLRAAIGGSPEAQATVLAHARHEAGGEA